MQFAYEYCQDRLPFVFFVDDDYLVVIRNLIAEVKKHKIHDRLYMGWKFETRPFRLRFHKHRVRGSFEFIFKKCIIALYIERAKGNGYIQGRDGVSERVIPDDLLMNQQACFITKGLLIASVSSVNALTMTSPV